MKKLIIFFITFLMAIQISAAERIIINSGHSSSVDALALDNKNQKLFSGDNNGTVKIWDLHMNRLSMNLLVSHLPVKKIAVNPAAPTIAVLTTDSLSNIKLSVWNWKTGKKLFSHRLSEMPLFFRYSPKGTYLVYGKPDWDSVTFLDAKKGYSRQILTGGTGIVSNAFISSSEKTILLYTPSGTIQYWALKTGKSKIHPIRTIGSLSSVKILKNGKYMSGYYDGNLYLINLVSGQVEDSIPMHKVEYAALDSVSGNIALVTKNTGTYYLSIYAITQNHVFLLIKKIKLDVIPSHSGIAFDNGYIYFSSKDGSLYKTTASTGITALFSQNILRTISDIGIIQGSMLIATNKNLIKVDSDLFNGSTDTHSFHNFLVSSYPNNLNGPTGIVTSHESSFFLYTKGNTPGVLEKFAPYEDVIFSSDFSSPLVSIQNIDNSFLSLENNGRCSIIDEKTGKTLFSYTSYGIQSVTRIFDGNIVAGRTQTGLIKEPLLKINVKTEEVVPIRDNNILSFMVGYDPVTRTLYSLGFEQKGNSLKTVLKSHKGSSLEITRTLLTYPGEDSAASFVIDKKKSRVFTSLGFGGISMLSWNGFTSLETSAHIPRKLHLYKNILFSVNSDSSITLWDTTKGTIIMDMYLLKNGGWVAIRKDGKIFSSENAKQAVIRLKN